MITLHNETARSVMLSHPDFSKHLPSGESLTFSSEALASEPFIEVSFPRSAADRGGWEVDVERTHYRGKTVLSISHTTAVKLIAILPLEEGDTVTLTETEHVLPSLNPIKRMKVTSPTAINERGETVCRFAFENDRDRKVCLKKLVLSLILSLPLSLILLLVSLFSLFDASYEIGMRIMMLFVTALFLYLPIRGLYDLHAIRRYPVIRPKKE